MGVQTALGTRCKVPHEGPDTNRRAIKIYLCVHFSPSLLTWVLRTGRATGKGKSLQARIWERIGPSSVRGHFP